MNNLSIQMLLSTVMGFVSGTAVQTGNVTTAAADTFVKNFGDKITQEVNTILSHGVSFSAIVDMIKTVTSAVEEGFNMPDVDGTIRGNIATALVEYVVHTFLQPLAPWVAFLFWGNFLPNLVKGVFISLFKAHVTPTPLIHTMSLTGAPPAGATPAPPVTTDGGKPKEPSAD